MSVFVGKATVLQRIVLIKYGTWDEEARRLLNRELIEHRKARPTLSRQAINGWFEKHSYPSRAHALEFVYDFFRKTIWREHLPPERMAVYASVNLFLRSVCPSTNAYDPPTQLIRMTKSGVLFSNKIGPDEVKVLASTLAGSFLAYHYRFSEDERRPISREGLRIFRSGNALRFELWFRREDIAIDRFHGTILGVGNLLWFIGAAEQSPTKLRVMHFRRTATLDMRHNSLRWGIVSGDIPLAWRSDPAAARICLIKAQENNARDASYLRSAPAYLGLNEMEHEPHGPTILRLIDNRMTATSHPHTIIPARKSNSEELIDTVLKVDQMTIENASDAIFGENARLPGEKGFSGLSN